MATPAIRSRPIAVRLRESFLTILTWIIVLVVVFPVLWMIFTAFKNENDAASIPPSIFVPLTLDNFANAFDRGLGLYFVNSIVASVLSTVLVMCLAIPAAYALSIRPIYRWRDALFFFISTRFMPVAASIIPVFMILKAIGGLDNIFALMMLYVGMNLPIAIWMMRSFFSEVPMELVEAAQIDGANLRVEMMKIVMPIVGPGVAAAALICFIFAWNEYFLVSMITASADARTLPPFLASFVDGRGQFLAKMMAACTLAVIPVVAAGWLAQKRLVRGLAMGAIK
jgi:sorbitol/mannitol transport system permease protein